MPTRALIIVDMQNDFMPGGNLAVPGSDEVIDIINRLADSFELVVATQDWHPAEHGSFASQHPGQRPGEVIDLHGLEQVLWPDHCVQKSTGAEFVAGLDTEAVGHVFRKGTDPAIDSYSGFFDNGHRKATGMGHFLAEANVESVLVCGVATDYCVKFTVLDALELGFDVTLIVDACRGVNLEPDDSLQAIQDMESAGAHVAQAKEFIHE